MAQKQTRISEEVKTFVVKAQACFDPPRVVIAAVKEEFGVTLGITNVLCYHPDRYAGRTLSKKWVDLFRATRENFLKDASSIPIANSNYRLRKMQQLLELAEDRKNPVLAASILEQAAKEAGGIFTNKSSVDMGISTVTIVGGLPDGD